MNYTLPSVNHQCIGQSCLSHPISSFHLQYYVEVNPIISLYKSLREKGTGKEEDYLRETEMVCMEQTKNKWIRICNLVLYSNHLRMWTNQSAKESWDLFLFYQPFWLYKLFYWVPFKPGSSKKQMAKQDKMCKNFIRETSL